MYNGQGKVWRFSYNFVELPQQAFLFLTHVQYTRSVYWLLKCVLTMYRQVDFRVWQKSCPEIHEVILAVSWKTLQEVWLQSPEMVIPREWGMEMLSSHDSTQPLLLEVDLTYG